MAGQAVSLPHPLVDESGPGWVASSTSAPIVSLNAGRSALLADATRAGSRVALITPPHSRLTFPLFHLLRLLGGAWLTRDGGVLRDAIDGGRVPGPAWVLDRSGLDGADAALGTPPDHLSGRLDGTRFRPWLQFTVAVHHPARAETLLGATAAALVERFTGSAPRSWGTAEPAAAGWDRAGITALARSRMPGDTRIYFAGAHGSAVTGIVRAARSDIGVTEETRVLIPLPAPESGIDDASVLELLSELAERSQVLMATSWASRGPADATIAPYWPSTPQPVAAVVGARGVRSMGLDIERLEREIGAVRVGNRRTPSLAVGFGADEVRWSRFAAALTAVGPGVLADALLPATAVGSGGRRAD